MDDSKPIRPSSEIDTTGQGDELESLRIQNNRLSTLYEIALTAGKSLELKDILNESLQKIIHFMGVDSGVIYILNEETLELIPVSFVNISDEAVNDLCENRVKVGECVCGTIAECDQEILIYEGASDDSRFTRESIRKEGMEFYAGLPLRAKGRVIGVLCVITHVPYRPDEELMDILRAATVPLSLAIDNARIFQDTLKKAEPKIKHFDFQEIVSISSKMRDVLDLVRKVTDLPTSILVYGESGTGKELVARAIHFNSIRKDMPFMAVNCSAIPETLLESEFFGHKKGAFTGATSDKDGLFQSADGGTLFLDEVEAMSVGLQAKLLRVLQDGTFMRVGSTSTEKVDVRVIAATNADLNKAVESGHFRKDLFYRLNVIMIILPPLRERIDDIPILSRVFAYRFSRKFGKNVRSISPEAMDVLMGHDWPGNVRELENAIERAVAVTESNELQKDDLPGELSNSEINFPESFTLDFIEKEHISKVLDLSQGNKQEAARILGINASTLWRKLKQ